MKTNKTTLLTFAVALGGCVSGAPRLTPDQQSRLDTIAVHKVGEKPGKEYSVLEEISAADCSGAPAGGRVWGNAEKAIGTLKRKAVVINAEAVVNISCSAVPFLNNCWAAQKCSGEAVVFK